ncbi:hypothetical protein F5X68DRAFT_15799 [Plectosphaerella plurivora]|uniref:NmrA-like domain-containing protein n=1 Tax=Plectosphaerella plurivora TaxID=936078 RepID=A0A9P9A832_9PEZI|nr:hypothetical protein F5X68DRAFT_15799 [Plectosphaerella plurivora]
MSTYLITQATGAQSREVIKHLLAGGAKIHALVRDPSKDLHPLLRDPAVTIFKGNSEDTDAVFAAAQGATGVFLNTFPIPGLEEQQAKSVVAAAKKAGITSIVASTSLAAGDRSLWDDEATKVAGLYGYFASKAAVEEVVKGAGFDNTTIVRPGFIHIDYLGTHSEGNWLGLKKRGELDHDYEENARMPQTVASDIGRWVAAALEYPAMFNGAEIELTPEALTVEEVSAIVSRVAGREVPARRRTPEERDALRGKFFVQGFHLWTNGKDLSRLVTAAKEAEAKYGIKFSTLEEGLTADRELLIATLP